MRTDSRALIERHGTASRQFGAELPLPYIFENFRGNLPAANQKKMQGNVRNLPAYLELTAHFSRIFEENLPAASQKKMQGNVRNLPAYLSRLEHA